MPGLQTRHEDDAVVISRGTDHSAELLNLCRTVKDMHREARNAEGALVLTAPGGRSVVLPESVSMVLEAVISQLVEEDQVSVVGTGRVLTTQEAANLLNVSRQYVARLLEDCRIPSHKVGTHHRVYARDVLDFKARRDARRERQLDNLVKLTEEFGGYEAEER